MTWPGALLFDIIELDFEARVDTILRSAQSRAEADRLVAELSANRRPSTFFYWVTRRV